MMIMQFINIVRITNKTVTRPQLCQYCAHNITIDWGLMVYAVDSAVPNSWENVLGIWEPLQVVTSGCCTHTLESANEKSTCRD
jgi:hypothetical protein